MQAADKMKNHRRAQKRRNPSPIHLSCDMRAPGAAEPSAAASGRLPDQIIFSAAC